MEKRLLVLELAALGLGLLLLHFSVLIIELQTAVITDWFVTVAPIIWVTAGIVAAYALLRPLLASETEFASVGDSPAGSPKQGTVDFRVLRRLSGDRRFLTVWIVAASLYALLYLLLQGILVVDPAGGLTPGWAALPSPVGYGPGLVWAPTASVGFVLRPYTLAAALSLSLLSGLVLALVLQLLVRGRSPLAALPTPLAGLGVVCPACLASPATGLVTAYLALLAGFGSLSLFTLTLWIATLLLVASLILLWMTIAWLSRIPEVSPAFPSAAGTP